MLAELGSDFIFGDILSQVLHIDGRHFAIAHAAVGLLAVRLGRLDLQGLTLKLSADEGAKGGLQVFIRI